MFFNRALLTLATCFPLALLLPDAVVAQEKTAQDQKSLSHGPKDDQEKVPPGKIDKNAKKKFTTTKSGLKYRILRQGKKDAKRATENDEVTVHNKGRLDKNKIFDSSYRRAEKISFPLKRVFPGWTEGMQLVGEGGMIELEIPAKLGYGNRDVGNGLIPANSTLHFLVELYQVKKSIEIK